MLGANGVVGGGFNIATGAALAIKQRHGSDVAVCFFGDGASSRGTFHEAVNLAASWKLPVIYVCENNAWASTTRFDDIKNVDYLSERAQGYGIPGVTVDGNDVESVRDASAKLIDRARRGDGPLHPGMQDLPARRPLHHRPAEVPFPGGGRGVETLQRPD